MAAEKGGTPAGASLLLCDEKVRSIFARCFAVDWEQKKTSHRFGLADASALRSSPFRGAMTLRKTV